MRREWNEPVFASEIEDDETAAGTLAAVAEPRYLDALAQIFESLVENGQKAWIAADRGKYDADGQRVDGEEGVPGKFRTDGYGFQIEEGDWMVARSPELFGSGASHMIATELALKLTPAIVDSLMFLKSTLDHFGGQVMIAPYVREDEEGESHVLGYVFVWEHISKLGRGKMPDAKIEERLPLVIDQRGGDLRGRYPNPTIREPAQANGSEA